MAVIDLDTGRLTDIDPPSAGGRPPIAEPEESAPVKGGVIDLETGQFVSEQPIEEPAVLTFAERAAQAFDLKTPSEAQLDRMVDQVDIGIAGFAPAAAITRGAIIEPVAGLIGLAQALNPFAEEGAGGEAVRSVREALAFEPETEGEAAALEKLQRKFEPISAALNKAEKFLGDETLEATGSPALAALATTVPTALMEVVGIAGAKGFVKGAESIKKAARSRQVSRAVVEATPDIEQLKSASRAVYKELDNSGVTLRPKAFKGLVNRINQAARKRGFDKDLNPKTAAVLRRFNDELGTAPSLTDIDTLRKVAQNAAKALEPSDAALGSTIVDNIDQFLDVVTPTAFNKAGLKTSEISPKFKVAREVWGRARRSELINDAFEKAKNQASGFENGIVVQFRGILNNKKKARFFKPKELQAMQEVVRGTTSTNIAKVIGRLGFSEGHATNIIGGSLGIAGGAAIGGPVGAVAVPAIGQISRKLAQRLTRGKAEFSDQIVRAGDNADIIASAYIKNTPVKLRSPAELSELLSRPDIALGDLFSSKRAILRDAAEIAKGRQVINALEALPALGAPGAITGLEQEQQ